MSILVTVLTCNEYAYTKASIERLFSATKLPFTLLLIDNSFNNDGRVELDPNYIREGNRKLLCKQ